MGWGVSNPEPSPGVYDWTSLDARVALMTRTGATPVLVLCGAPDWMKGGKAGTTDWSQLEKAPLPEHYQDFADLAVQIAERYPQVRRFVVWNELKGFHDARTNSWDAAAYTALYNRVYDALKAHDPALAVGGPYVPVVSWSPAADPSHASALRGPWGVVDQRALDAIDYWLHHAHGADFVAVDAKTGTKDHGLTTGPVEATAKFTVVDAWLRQRTALPIWWTEFYATTTDTRLGGAAARELVTAQAAALVRMAADGVSAAFQWRPEADGKNCRGCLWSDTRSRSGGRAGTVTVH
jgi:hypothetical protein